MITAAATFMNKDILDIEELGITENGERNDNTYAL